VSVLIAEYTGQLIIGDAEKHSSPNSLALPLLFRGCRQFVEIIPHVRAWLASARAVFSPQPTTFDPRPTIKVNMLGLTNLDLNFLFFSLFGGQGLLFFSHLCGEPFSRVRLRVVVSDFCCSPPRVSFGFGLVRFRVAAIE